MDTKFVVRLLDAQGGLLAWQTVWALPRLQEPRGASCPFFAPGPTLFVIERDGRATQISVHWCDLDVARVVALIEPVDVTVGRVATYVWIEPVWLVPGMRDVPLPAVTVRQSVELVVPTGVLVGQPGS
jgi:hypothetical protein